MRYYAFFLFVAPSLLISINTTPVQAGSMLDSIYEVLFDDTTRDDNGSQQQRFEGRNFDPIIGDWDWKVAYINWNEMPTINDERYDLVSTDFSNTDPYEGDRFHRPPIGRSAFGEYWKYAEHVHGSKIGQISYHKTAGIFSWDTADNFGGEENSQWFTHPDFKDADGNQKYFMLATRQPEIKDWANVTESTLERDRDINENGDKIEFDNQCRHITYEDTDGTEQQAKRWCPESLEEIQEVFTHTQNDVDPRFTSNDFNGDWWKLSKYEYYAKWWIYNQNVMGFGGPDPNKQGMTQIYLKPKYYRFTVGLGMKRRDLKLAKYEYKLKDNQMKCAEGNSDWNIHESIDYAINEDNAKNLFRMDKAYLDDQNGIYGWDTINAPDGGMCYMLSPQPMHEGPMTPEGENGPQVDKKIYKTGKKWELKITSVPCWEVMYHSRPVCVISGDKTPDTIKNNAIDMKAGGIKYPEYIQRLNDLEYTYWYASMLRGIMDSIFAYWVVKTYGYFFCCCFCCKLPCCWEGWICGKGGALWESILFYPFRLCCYGGFCGFRCIKRVKDEEKADIEKAIKKKRDTASSSSSSDSD